MFDKLYYNDKKNKNNSNIKINIIQKNKFNNNKVHYLINNSKIKNGNFDKLSNLPLKNNKKFYNAYYLSNFFQILNKKIRFLILFFVIDEIKNLMLVSKTWKKEILLILKLKTNVVNNNFIEYSLKNSINFIKSYFVIINTKFGVRIDKLLKLKLDSELINKKIKWGFKYKIKKYTPNIFKNKNKFLYSNFEFIYLEKEKKSRKTLFIEHLNDNKSLINFNWEKPDIIYSNDYILIPITIYSKEGFIKKKTIKFKNIKYNKINFNLKNYLFDEPYFVEKFIDKDLISMSWSYSINDKRNILIPLNRLKKYFKLKEICSLGNEVIIVKGLFKSFNIGKFKLSDKNNENNINIRIIDKNDSFEYVIKNLDYTNDIYDVINLKIGDELLIIVKKYLY